MMKFLLDILQIAIALKIVWIVGKWLIRRKKKGTRGRRRSVISKLYALVGNKIHYRLDSMLKKQKEALRPQTDKTSGGKVVQFRKSR